jgi:hypothetical protein
MPGLAWRVERTGVRGAKKIFQRYVENRDGGRLIRAVGSMPLRGT